VRYYTGLGPLRVDVATPINPREDDSRFALYIGIGQAF
jgi:translocation and assembly module TamA